MLLWQGGKGPNENLPFDLDWTQRLAGDTITGSSWSIINGDAPAVGTLAIGANSFSTTQTLVWLSQGNLSQRAYVLQNTITTGSGDTLTETVELPMRNR